MKHALPSIQFSTIMVSILLCIFVVLALFIAMNNRVENDAAFHAELSREIAERRQIISSSEYLLSDANKNFPVAYPQLFHLTGGVWYQLIGNDAFTLLPILYGVLSIAFLYGILRRTIPLYSAILLAVSMLVANGNFLDYSSKYFMEIALVFGTMASLFYAIKYAQTKAFADSAVASFFFGITIAIKQQGFFLLPVFFLMLTFVSLRNRLHKHIASGIVILTIVVAAPLMQLFQSTGSILYAGDNPPHIVEMIEHPIRTITHVSLLPSDPYWTTLNEGRRTSEILRWRNIETIITAWLRSASTDLIPWSIFGIGMLLIVLYRIYRYRSLEELMIGLFIISFSGLFYILARPRYTLPLIILPSIIVVYVIYAFNHLPLPRQTTVLYLTAMLVYTSVNFAYDVIPIFHRDRFGFMGKEYTSRPSHLTELYNAIPARTDYPVILSPLPYETVYYTHKPVLWANPYGATELFQAFLKQEDEALPLLKKYRSGYIVLYSDRFLRFTNWVGINPQDGFLSNISSSRHFELIASNEVGQVYRILYNE